MRHVLDWYGDSGAPMPPPPPRRPRRAVKRPHSWWLLGWARKARKRPRLQDRRVIPPKLAERLRVIKKLRLARRRIDD
jgi:hypothetical protein